MIYSIKCLHNGHLLEYTKNVDKEPSQTPVMKLSEGKFCHIWLSLDGFLKFLKTQKERYEGIRSLRKYVQTPKVTKIVYKDADFVEVVIKNPAFFYEQSENKPQYIANYHPDLNLEAISKDFAEKRAVLDAELRKDAGELLEKGLITKEEYQNVFA